MKLTSTSYKRIIFLFFILAPLSFFGQIRAIVSPNNRFFAIEEFNGKKDENGVKVYEYEYKVFHLQTKTYLQSFFIHSKSKEQPNLVQFSPDGKLFSVKQLQIEKKLEIAGGIEKTEIWHHILKIWDVRTGNLITEDIGYDDLELVFFNQSHYYLLISKDEMRSFDTHKGSKILDYKYVKGTKIKSAFVSSDDKYIVIINNLGQSMFWLAGTPKMLKRISGNEVKFSYDMQFVTTYRVSGPNLSAYVYKIPTFERIKNISASKILRDMAKKERDKIKAENPDMKSIVLPTYKIDPSKSNFGPFGKYMVTYTERQYNEPPMLEKKLVFIDIFKGKAIYEVEETNDKLSLFPYKWAGNSIFLLQADSFNIDVLNLKAEQFVQNLELDMEYDSNEKGLTPDKQLKTRIVSPNKRYVIVPVVGSKTDFYIKCTYLDIPKTLVQNLQFIDFSPNSRQIFLKNAKNEIVVINTVDFESIGGKTINFEKTKATPDSLKTPEMLVLNEFKAGTPYKEDVVEEDAEAPQGFEYIRAGNLREMESLDSYDKLFLYTKSIEMYREKLGIQFHLMDNFGNLIQGAGSEAWKKIWCNLIVEFPDGKVQQINDFELTEYSANDSMKTAIAIVLDHSGSMGDNRARLLQEGAQHFIKNKRNEDAIAIVKYDHNVGIETELTNDKNVLIKQLTMNGLGRFGGATSLLDGINEGISLLNNATDYQRKAVIVLTDGNENSSYLSKNEVVTRAIRSNINVHVIGFGEFINQPFLAGIANHTEGSYYQMYDRQDFKWIFTDVYQRIKNYYGISFNTQLQGNYKVFIEICPQKIESTKLASEFDYSPIDLDEVALYFDAKDAFLQNSHEIEKNVAENAKYTIKPLTNFDKIKILSPKGELISLSIDSSSVNIAPIVEEFNNLTFPDIKFEYNDATIIEGTADGLEEIAAFLKKNSAIIIEIGGHTDDVGDPKRNRELSERRAINVKKKLLALGVDSDRVQTNGYGDSRPVVDNSTEDNRSLNRRVEFKIINY